MTISRRLTITAGMLATLLASAVPVMAAPLSGGASGGGAIQGGSGAPGSGVGIPGAIVNGTTATGIGMDDTRSLHRHHRRMHRRTR